MFGRVFRLLGAQGQNFSRQFFTNSSFRGEVYTVAGIFGRIGAFSYQAGTHLAEIKRQEEQRYREACHP